MRFTQINCGATCFATCLVADLKAYILIETTPLFECFPLFYESTIVFYFYDGLYYMGSKFEPYLSLNLCITVIDYYLK